MKRIGWGLLALMAVAIIIAMPKLNAAVKVATGYKTKITCSEVFVAGRDFDDVVATNFFGISPFIDKAKVKIDRERQTISGHMMGMGRSLAVYREGLGCTVNAGKGVSEVMIPSPAPIDHEYETEIDSDIQAAVLAMFDDAALAHPIVTRGVVVIQNGKVVGEHYKDGFTRETRQQSWSMAKGFTQALVGILVGDDILSLDDTELMPDWQGDSPKANITLGNLLHMASGLSFSENYADPWSDVDQMLFNQRDMGAFAASRAVAHTPGTQSIYASGTTNIVSKYMQAKMNAAGANYHALPQTRLFNKIGMSSAIFEVDPAGTFIGSSYIYATPRDFARFGQLYLQDGVWEGERILPEGWVEYTGEGAPNSGGKYGSHWSINAGRKNYPNLPDDIINLGGNDGQYIFVIPSKNAVIVRLGVTRWPATFEGEVLPLIEAIYETL